MNVITIESDAYNEIMNSIKKIEEHICNPQTKPLSEIWYGIEETCKILQVSKRTLQNYCDTGVLSFSQTGGKIYFCAKDIQAHMERHYIKAFRSK